MSLQAAIKKRFSGFSLDVSLNTDGGVMGHSRRLRKRQNHDAQVYRQELRRRTKGGSC